jgi:tRNA 2-thiouridine synthesizing protein A
LSLAAQHRVVDSRGTACPAPVIDLFKAARTAEAGDIIDVLATCPGAKPGVQSWVRKNGNELLDVIDEKDHTRFIVKITKKGGIGKPGPTK